MIGWLRLTSLPINQKTYTEGTWFTIGVFAASAAWSLYLRFFVVAGVCVTLAILWYVGLRQTTGGLE